MGKNSGGREDLNLGDQSMSFLVNNFGDKYKGIVFDLDGTLVDSAPVVASILNGFRIEKGMEVLSVDCYRLWSSEGGALLVGNALEIEYQETEAWVNLFRKRYLEFPTPPSSLYPNVLNALSALVEKGLRLAICSNKPERLCHKVTEETGIKKYFNGIIGGDTLSQKKPSKEPLLYAIKSLSIEKADVLFIGDSGIDKETASAAEVDFAHFDSGYDPSIELDVEDFVLSNYDQLISYISC